MVNGLEVLPKFKGKRKINWSRSVLHTLEHERFGPFRIVEYFPPDKDNKLSRVTVQFERTGYLTTAQVNDVRLGRIRDKLQPTVCGVGKLGYHESPTGKHNPSYILWLNIIKRCYKDTAVGYKHYGGKGVTVCDRWKWFDYFEQDIKLLPNYDKWLANVGNGLWSLDKDLKAPSNGPKIYSPEHCVFMLQKDNLKLRYNNENNGDNSGYDL